MSLLPLGNPLQKTWYHIPPLPPPSPPFLRGERVGVRGDRTPMCRAPAAMPMASELLPEDGGFLSMGFFAFAVERSYAAEHDGLSYTIS
jgi:hypothetical protein